MSMMDIFRRKKPETRSAGDPFYAPQLSGLNTTGRLVNPRLAENLATILACVEAISGGIASLPAYVYRWQGDERIEATDHPLARLIRKGPNQWQSWPDFIQFFLAQALLRGNALAIIETDGAGRVTGLRPIPWEWVAVQLLPSGRLAFDVTEQSGVYGGVGGMRRYLQDEVLHLRDRSDDGLVGRSRLQRAAHVISTAVDTQELAGNTYRNGMHPSGAIESQSKLTDDSRTRLRTALNDMHQGASRGGKTLILEQGLAFKPLSITPEDGELLASRRYSGEELARIYQVPPPIIGDLSHGTFTNSETVGRWFAQQTLAQWIRKLEAEFARSVFSEATRATHELEFDLSAFLRGDPETRWRSHEIALRNRVLTPNEIRETEGWNRREGGDAWETAPAAEGAA